MIASLFPNNYEQKINFTEIKQLLQDAAGSPMGKELAAALTASSDFGEISLNLKQTDQMLRLMSEDRHIPYLCTDDSRHALHAIQPQGTYMEESELLMVANMLDSLEDFRKIILSTDNTKSADDIIEEKYEFPELAQIVQDAPSLPKTAVSIRALFNEEQQIADNASKELYRIRRELRNVEQSISGAIRRIARQAKEAGWIDADVHPALRDGRLVIPLPPEHKRKLKGIVYDESATGKTVYVEPAEIVEANNMIRELEAEERREIIKILTGVADKLRPNLKQLLDGVRILGLLDFIRAKAKLAQSMSAVLPQVTDKPLIRWQQCRHPLLERSLEQHGRAIVPLDITLEEPKSRFLVISGPNAGGKSVCLKTVGLLQLMLQSGLLLPLDPNSRCGIFSNLCIDIGDEQSIEDDLSTYSSHLANMKQFVKIADERTLILIDEFGSGTEPQIGGAIAQSLLNQFNKSEAFGIVTTHFQNLKTFAEETPGIINGAMLYDRHRLQPLFKLETGRPGSSFAIEIARKIGLPENVIQEATDIVGTDYVNMDKFLQDIVRDKRYWEQKRANIRREEKRLEELTGEYSRKIETIDSETKKILSEARDEAREIIKQSGKEIERTIREIKEAEAEKERTRLIRARLNSYEKELALEETADLHIKEEKYRRELEKIKRREKRKQQKKNKQIDESVTAKETIESPSLEKQKPFKVGDAVRISGQKAIGSILEMKDDTALISMGGIIKSYVPLTRLHHAVPEEKKGLQKSSTPIAGAKMIVDQIHEKRLHFKQDLDVRGMRANEAVQSVSYFIDDAIQLGISRVRILHGTGTGALRMAIREYLEGVGSVRKYADEHVQFGGAGITVVDLE